MIHMGVLNIGVLKGPFLIFLFNMLIKQIKPKKVYILTGIFFCRTLPGIFFNKHQCLKKL
jgi:hypothetical protein